MTDETKPTIPIKRNNKVVVSTDENFFQKNARSALWWIFTATILFDFILAPIGYSILQTTFGGDVGKIWVPLTLQANGLYFLSMGILLGVNSYGKDLRKLKELDVNNQN